MTSVRNSVFDRLIRLYGERSQEATAHTPLEDFTTEIFASILERNTDVLKAFLAEIVGIESEVVETRRLVVKTQDHYRVDGDTNCRVDLAIRGEDFLCFVENKVHSTEGYHQLDRYATVLAKQHERIKHLGYCTKYCEESREGVRQYRWADVHKLLSRFQSDTLITNFTDFLRRNGMGSFDELSLHDLNVMQGVVYVFEKLGSILEEVKIDYDQITGRRAKCSERYKQIGRFQRYVCFDKNVLSGEGYSELGFGFDLSESPSLYMWIWADEKSEIWTTHKDRLFEALPDGKRDDRSYLAYLTPLSDLLSKRDMQNEIRMWFAEKFERIAQYEGFKKNVLESQEDENTEEDE